MEVTCEADASKSDVAAYKLEERASLVADVPIQKENSNVSVELQKDQRTTAPSKLANGIDQHQKTILTSQLPRTILNAPLAVSYPGLQLALIQ